ncbi:MAG TPA: ABC transporter permease [Acidimicrobiales bacterium]|nr:ABC transporter permease [Acidimicrobiales bacterium]
MPELSADVPAAPTTLVSESSAELTLSAQGADPEREVKKLGFGFWLATAWLILIIGLCALAPVLPFVDDKGAANDAARAYISENQTSVVPPSLDNWLGADSTGNDILSQVIWGGRNSLLMGVSAVAFGFVIGGTLGVTAGYFGGRYEKIVIGSMDIMLAFPALVLALALVTFLSEPGTQNATTGTVILTLTILAVPALARITRASTLTYAQREFVTAARALGARDSRIIAREILPNVIPPMAAFALIAIAIVIVAEGALSFLGLSLASPNDTWGKLIEQGRPDIEEKPWISLAPCGVMFLTLLSFNYVGDQLRRYFDVKEAAL